MRTFKQARETRKNLEKDFDGVKEILADGAFKAKGLADQTLKEVYASIGILNSLNKE